MQQAFACQLQDGFLEGADEVQLGEHGAEKLWRCGFPVLGGGRQFDPGGAGLEALFAWHVPTSVDRERSAALAAVPVNVRQLDPLWPVFTTKMQKSGLL